MATVEQIREQLLDVYDPELMMDVVNLGLVYDIEVEEEGKKVSIVMTLTTLGCPAGDYLREEVIEKVSALDGVEQVEVFFTFDPPWSQERMSEEARTMLRYLF